MLAQEQKSQAYLKHPRTTPSQLRLLPKSQKRSKGPRIEHHSTERTLGIGRRSGNRREQKAWPGVSAGRTTDRKKESGGRRNEGVAGRRSAQGMDGRSTPAAGPQMDAEAIGEKRSRTPAAAAAPAAATASSQSDKEARCGGADEPAADQSTTAEDAARLRLMEIVRTLPGEDLPGNDLHGAGGFEGASPKAAPSLPRIDSGDEIRRKLITISYAEADWPPTEGARPDWS